MSDPRKEDGRCEGERRKAEAFGKIEANREAILRKARRAFATLGLANGCVTIDDVRAAVELPPGTNPTCFGPVATPFARMKFVERVGFVESARPEAHCRPVGVWEVTSRDGLRLWLATHPELPMPTANNTGESAGTDSPANSNQSPNSNEGSQSHG